MWSKQRHVGGTKARFANKRRRALLRHRLAAPVEDFEGRSSTELLNQPSWRA